MPERNWLDGPGLVRLLESHGVRPAQLTTTERRAWTRWKNGSVVFFYTVDDLLTRVGIQESEIPDEIWTTRRSDHVPRKEKEKARAQLIGGAAVGRVAAELGVDYKTVWNWKQKLVDEELVEG